MEMLPTHNLGIPCPGAGLVAASVNPAGCVLVVLWDNCFLEIEQMSLCCLKYMYTYMYFFLPPASHRASLFLCGATQERYEWQKLEPKEVTKFSHKLNTDGEVDDMFKIGSNYKECAHLAMTSIGHSLPWPS